jgi:hypothetical protein
MAEFFDIVIVGGGPAVRTAGTCWHYRERRDFEKEEVPRLKIGESLLSGSLRTFEPMGVKEKIDSSRCDRQIWRQDRFRLRHSEQSLSFQ